MKFIEYLVRHIRSKSPFAALSDRSYFTCAILLFAFIVVALLYISSLFMSDPWTMYDTGRFYTMAHVIASGATPYVDYQDPKPPLIFFTLAVPVLLGHPLLGGLLLVGLCDLASAILAMLIAREYYGRSAGLAAGLLFLLNIGWAQGYFVMTEPFAIPFILLATYLVLCGRNKHYFIAGLCAGIAIGFKQYALISIPSLLAALYLNKEFKKAPAFLAGVALPLFAIFGAVFLAYGVQALNASIFWSFSVAGPYISGASVDGVIQAEKPGILELAINIAIAVALSASFIVALARIGRDRKLSAGETYFLLSAVGYALTLLIRHYPHYWIFALPFFAITWAGGLFKDSGKKLTLSLPGPRLAKWASATASALSVALASVRP